MAELQRARVLFLIRVPVARTDDFLRAYERIRYQVAEGVDGHLVDQVCASPTDPEQWLITSEWRTLAHFDAWESSAEHRELVRPLRACISEARSMRFTVLAQTSARDRAEEPRQVAPEAVRAPGPDPMVCGETGP